MRTSSCHWPTACAGERRATQRSRSSRPRPPDDERRTRFLEAVVPDLAAGGRAPVDVFTVAGQRLPPLVRQVAGDALVGTADTRESVLRIEKGALRAGLRSLDERGPSIVPRVAGVADPLAQADPETIVVGQRFAVYEIRECQPTTPGAPSCLDLNGDGGQTDYVLQAIDLAAADAVPFVIDAVEGRDFPGYPASFPPFALYSFSASDHVVAFRIPEENHDLDGDGAAGELLHSGAFDLRRRVPIAAATGSARQEVAGPLLAFTAVAADGADVLWWYDATRSAPGPFLAADAARARIAVTRAPTGRLPRALRVHPYDLAIAGGRIAVAVPEAAQGEDVTRDGDRDDVAVVVLDTAAGVVTNPAEPLAADGAVTSRDPLGRPRLAASPRWIAFQAERLGSFGLVGVVGLLDGAAPDALARLVCGDPLGHGLLVPSISDAIVPCLEFGQLHVLAPGGGPGPAERNLGITLGSVFDVHVAGEVLAVGVDEAAHLEDLNGDGDFADHVVHTFHTRTGVLTAFRHDVVRSEAPYLDFIRRGLVTIAGRRDALVRSIFRDVDEDGACEEVVAGPAGARLADNCPTRYNPGQEDEDDDGVGDACRCPVLDVGTVQAFAGSRVRVPIDLDPGTLDPAALNLTLRYARPEGVDALTCVSGPVTAAADAEAVCRLDEPPGEVLVAVLNAPRVPVPVLGRGELASVEFAVSPDAVGATVPACVAAEDVRIGSARGPDLCVGPSACGEIRFDRTCTSQGDCNCDGEVNSGDRVCLVSKFFDPTQRGTCPCEDCNQSGELNAADAPCITLCAFDECVTGRR